MKPFYKRLSKKQLKKLSKNQVKELIEKDLKEMFKDDLVIEDIQVELKEKSKPLKVFFFLDEVKSNG